MDDQKLNSLLRQYIQEKQITIPEDIQKRFASHVMFKLDQKPDFLPYGIGILTLALVCFLCFQFMEHKKHLVEREAIQMETVEKAALPESTLETPLVKQKERIASLPEQAPPISPQEEIEAVFKDLSDDAIMDLLVELEGTDFLMELGHTFFADEMELFDSIEIVATS